MKFFEFNDYEYYALIVADEIRRRSVCNVK